MINYIYTDTHTRFIFILYFSGEFVPNRITGIRQHLGNWRAAPLSSIIISVDCVDAQGLCHVREPPWTLICLLRLPLWLNLSRHSLHWYGFSPEWIRKCLVSVELSENAFLQNRHLEKEINMYLWKRINKINLINLIKSILSY